MKLSKRAVDSLNKFGEYTTKNYRYYIGMKDGKEYVKRCTVTRYGYMPHVYGKPENVCVWKGVSWKVF